MYKESLIDKESLIESPVCEISITFNSVWFYTPKSLPL